MLDELVKTVLVILVGFAVRWLFTLTGVEIDEATFNAIVGAIVVYLLALLGYAGARKLRPSLFRVD
jgi:multisubunit Na+/H+ antiporter MnhE subunit